LVEHGLRSAPTQYRLYGRPFLQVRRPNQQYQSTEGNIQNTQFSLRSTSWNEWKQHAREASSERRRLAKKTNLHTSTTCNHQKPRNSIRAVF